MLDNLLGIQNQFAVQDRVQKERLIWLGFFAMIMGLAGLLGLFMVRQGPAPVFIAWMIYLAGAALILSQPRNGLYLILFFSLIGDYALLPWYPFNKGFSASESIFHLSKYLIFSPLEVYILLTLASWLVHGVVLHNLKFRIGILFRPAAVFLGFVIAGLIYGLITGGNSDIALWQVRPLFYLIAMIFLTSNLLEKPAHASNLMWAVMLGLFIKSLVALIDYLASLKGSFIAEAFMEHAAAVQLNSVFVFALAVWLYKSSSSKRLLLPLMIPVILVPYLAFQRRSAMAALIIGLVLFAVILYKENRRAFWLIVLPAACLFGVYVLAFWNSSSALGVPAQAIKSFVAPTSISVRNQASDVYRYIENFDLNFTLHQRPITGIGFGQPFYLPISLPDISWFLQWQYYPHNSIIWMWLSTGVGGFIAMLFMVGLAIITGLNALSNLPRSELRAVALTATLYIVMHFIFAYVDISWDIESMLYIGAMMGLIESLERIASQPLEFTPKRWRWQLDPGSGTSLASSVEEAWIE